MATILTHSMVFHSPTLLFALVLLLGGCGQSLLSKPPPVPLPVLLKPQPSRSAPTESDVIKTKDYVFLLTKPRDTLRSLAKRFLGDEANFWVIADFNNLRRLAPGQEIVIPLSTKNAIGVYANGYQTVPILAYHHFGLRKGKLIVTPDMFDAHMAYLNTHDYRVIPLSDLTAFFKGQKPLPRRAIVITLDDGYKSAYTIAYPILKKYGFPATLFVYSDFIGSSGGLHWHEMAEMVASKLIDIQPHSMTHSNLGLREPTEDDTLYAQRVEKEIRRPSHQIQQHLRLPIHTFNYPYGDTTDTVIAHLQKHDFQMGVTVQRGGNPSFAPPFLLRRTLVYGNQSLAEFQKSLEVFQEEKLY